MKHIKTPLAFLAFTSAIGLLLIALGFLNDAPIAYELAGVVLTAGYFGGLLGLGVGLLRMK